MGPTSFCFGETALENFSSLPGEQSQESDANGPVDPQLWPARLDERVARLNNLHLFSYRMNSAVCGINEGCDLLIYEARGVLETDAPFLPNFHISKTLNRQKKTAVKVFS